MCRYAAYLGPKLLLSELIYKPANSLVHQATEAMQSLTRINADGFGVGWYAPEISPEPAVFKDTSPVWNNRNLGSIADKIESPCIFGHIRKASSYDPVTRENCHPFDRGKLLWMHNGDIPGRARLSRMVVDLAADVLLAKIRGNTDSEMAFTIFLSFLDDPFGPQQSAQDLASAMEKTIEKLTAWHRDSLTSDPLETNFCVTDGSSVVATRYAISDTSKPSLFWYEGENATDGRHVIVASEPLTDGDSWNEVPDSSLVVVDEGLSVEVRPLETGRS